MAFDPKQLGNIARILKKLGPANVVAVLEVVERLLEAERRAEGLALAPSEVLLITTLTRNLMEVDL
jgi:hypothetical protein